MELLNLLFGAPEEINGGRCPTYLYRWRIMGGSTRNGHKTGRAIYLHHFVGNDWSRDMHDHPKRFITIGLWGSYLETTGTSIDGDPPKYRLYRAPWIRSFPATHRHRIEARNCWTLVITLRVERDWGFWHRGVWYPWREYVKGKASALADSMKSCE